MDDETADERQRHADALRRAIQASGFSKEDVATAVDRNPRTIGNWTAHRSPTMPSPKERQILRRLLGENYDATGDRVERAIRGSGLDEWRQSEVLALYQRHLHEQARDRAVS